MCVCEMLCSFIHLFLSFLCHPCSSYEMFERFVICTYDSIHPCSSYELFERFVICTYDSIYREIFFIS